MNRCLRAGSLLLLVLTVARPSSAQPSGPPLTPDHWSYELLDALDAAGVADAWMSDFRPSGRAVVRGELRRVVRGRFGASDLTSRWLGRFDRRMPLRRGDRTGSSWEIRAGVGGRGGDALLDPGDGLVAAAGAAARLGPVSLWLEGGGSGRERFDEGLHTAGVSLPLGPFQVAAGRVRMKAAGPSSTSVQLGGRLPVDALYLVSRDRAQLPRLGWLLGPTAWHFALMPQTEAGQWDRGWMGMGGVVTQPTSDLRVGVIRTARFGGAQVAPFSAARLLRTTLMRQNEPFNWDDQKVELTFRYRWKVGEQPVAAHLVLGQEDPPPWRDPAVLTGMTLPVVRSSGLWVLRYEYQAFGARARWCPICEFDSFTPGGAFASAHWYRHSGQPAYRRRGLPVGAALGGYGASHTARLRVWDRDARFRLEGWTFFQVREEDNLLFDRWPGKRRGGGLGFLWFPTPDLEIEGRALAADGPKMEAEWGVEATVEWAVGGASESPPGVVAGSVAGAPPGGTRDLERGSRVRVWSPRVVDRRAQGTVASVDGEHLELEATDGAPPRRIPLSSIRRVRTATGTHAATYRGAFLGTVVGLVAAIVYDEATGARPEPERLKESRWGLRAGITAAGTGLGALVGRMFDVEAWRDVDPR